MDALGCPRGRSTTVMIITANDQRWTQLGGAHKITLRQQPPGWSDGVFMLAERAFLVAPRGITPVAREDGRQVLRNSRSLGRDDVAGHRLTVSAIRSPHTTTTESLQFLHR